MRILIATRQLGFGGGVETHLEAVLPLLHTRGHTLGILHEDSPQPGQRTVLANLPEIPRIPAARLSPKDVIRNVASFRPDFVYNHGLDSPDLEAALVQRFPALLYAHNYYGICISGTRCHSQENVVPCQRAFGPACLALYLPKHCGGRHPWTMIQRYRVEARRHRTLRQYAAILVASRYVASQFLQNGIPADKIHHVPLFPPGITPSPTPPAPRPITGRVLFLGRITHLKGLHHLTEALVQSQTILKRPLQLLVGGEGSDRNAILALARKKGLDSQALGWVSTDARNRLMNEVDLLAVPSLWPEPFGLVGLEAACAGVPAVAYASGGIPDWLIPGRTGELAEATPPHPADLSQAIVRALQNPSHWQSLRLGAWSHSHAWTPDAHIGRLTQVIQKISSPHVELAR